MNPNDQPISMRADDRFVTLVNELWLWEYWTETRSRPDVCDLPAEKDFEVCVELNKVRVK